jgi:hypothetical protein
MIRGSMMGGRERERVVSLPPFSFVDFGNEREPVSLGTNVRWRWIWIDKEAELVLVDNRIQENVVVLLTYLCPLCDFIFVLLSMPCDVYVLLFRQGDLQISPRLEHLKFQGIQNNRCIAQTATLQR